MTANRNTAAAGVAIKRRARIGIVVAALDDNESHLQFWVGVDDAAQALINGSAARMAEKDAQTLPNQEQTSLQAAAAALPVCVKNLTMAEVQQLLAAQGFKAPADLVAHRDIGAGQVFKNDEVALIADLQDEHAQARADVGNGTGLHCMGSSAGKAAMVGQQGGAA